jgi:hypothetical protein
MAFLNKIVLVNFFVQLILERLILAAASAVTDDLVLEWIV